MTERIKKLKEMQNAVKPSISAERAVLATEAIEKYAFFPPVLQKAYMLRYILENMTVFIQEGELLVGNHTSRPRCTPVYPEFNSQWILEQMEDFPVRGTDPLIVPYEDKKALMEVLPKWKGISLDQTLEEALPEKAKYAEKCGILTMGNRDCGTGHVLPDYYNLIRKGLVYYKEKCKKLIDETEVDCKEKQEKVDFWNSVIITIDAARIFANRYSILAENMAEKENDDKRKQELLEISRICKKVPYEPAESFYEAVQFVWFIHLIINIESNGHGNSYHRFDQYMNEFYVNDLKNGTIIEERAIEILDCFFIKNTDIIKLRDKFYSESFAGYPMWQNIIVGGQKPDGSDATNETSFLVLKANRDVHTSSPTASVRYFDGINKELMEESLKMIQDGLATPAFFNDKLVVPMVMDKQGVSVEEARNWGIMGCVQPVVAGYTDGRPTVGYVNLLKCLELVIHNGINPIDGKQLGPQTGDFRKFTNLEQLQEALYKQISYFADLMITGFNIVGAMHAARTPMVFTSMVVNDSIDKGLPIQCGGARYSESGAFMCGI